MSRNKNTLMTHAADGRRWRRVVGPVAERRRVQTEVIDNHTRQQQKKKEQRTSGLLTILCSFFLYEKKGQRSRWLYSQTHWLTLLHVFLDFTPALLGFYVLSVLVHKRSEGNSGIRLFIILTLAAAMTSADAHTDATEEDERQKTCSSCYQNGHVERIWKGQRENVSCVCEQTITCGNVRALFERRHSHSMTFSCCATQLFGEPTLLDDSQRYNPASTLDTLLNFCSRQEKRRCKV